MTPRLASILAAVNAALAERASQFDQPAAAIATIRIHITAAGVASLVDADVHPIVEQPRRVARSSYLASGTSRGRL